MLVINNLHAKSRARGTEDEGAVLVAVLIVMLVGFIVVSTIASALIFTMGFNTTDRYRLQAFIAAESGRDAAVAELHSSTGCTTGTTTLSHSGSDPIYTATIYATSNATQPTSDSGLTASCPTSSSTFVVIKSTGSASNGTTATIDAVYPWVVTYQQQAGGLLTYFSNGVTTQSSSYTGDLVVRSGDYNCTNAGTINGNIYVTNGSANFSSACTVNGSVYASANVTSSSQNLTITGQIQAGGYVSLASDGYNYQCSGVPTPVSGAVPCSGNVTAGGTITLSNQGTNDGYIFGKVQSASTITVGSKWHVSGTQSPNTTFPGFNPTMAWIYGVTSWIDLDAATSWNPQVSVNPCSLTDAQVTALLSAATTSLLLDYTQCSSNKTNINLSAVTVTRDAVFLAPTASQLNVAVNGALAGSHQLFFVHADSSRNLVNGQSQPDCGNGNQNDTFNVASGASNTDSMMLYTPCGLTGTIRMNFSGQLYTNQGGLNFNNGASYTCQAMSWTPALPLLGCSISGGAGSIIVTTITQALGGRLWQSEK